MKCTIIGVTSETNGISKEKLENLKVLSGRNAGVCYSNGWYFDSTNYDEAKALKRFKSTANRAHHSIADHVSVEVMFEGLSKMMAIILNSLQDYATSEKSGRYTSMFGNTKEECELYTKWFYIFRKRIFEIEPDIDDIALSDLMAKKGHDDVIIKNGRLSNGNMSDDDECHQSVLGECKTSKSLPSVKLAQENARYVLSVFTRSTSMGYTTSLRQWNYIYDWCLKYMNQFGIKDNVLWSTAFDMKASDFEVELYSDMKSLAEFIKENLYVEELRDTKDRCFEFLTQMSGQYSPMVNYYIPEAPDADTVSDDDHLGVTYNVSYSASFVQIAQAERHRTLKYFMLFNPYNRDLLFFVPPCIRGTEYEDMWLNDLKSVSHLYPQATMVGIIETGHISDFVLKCKERLCGRAQLEIMEQTKKTAERFIAEVRDDVYKQSVLRGYVSQFSDEKGECKTKCKMCKGCKEPCRYGAEKALNRKL